MHQTHLRKDRDDLWHQLRYVIKVMQCCGVLMKYIHRNLPSQEMLGYLCNYQPEIKKHRVSTKFTFYTLIYIANHLPWRRQCNRLLSFKLSLFASLASFNAPFKCSLTCVSSWRCLNFDMFSVPTKGFKSHFFTQHLVKHPIKALKKTTWTFSSPFPVIQTEVLVSGLSSIMAGHGGKSNNSAHLIEPTIMSDATVDLLEASGSSGASQP